MPTARCLKALLVVAIIALPHPAQADPLYLFGTIGNLPVVVNLVREGGTVTGWYFYRSTARLIRLEGTIDSRGSFRLTEQASGRTTGVFSGAVSGGRWTGAWQKAGGGAPLTLALVENHANLTDLTANVTCAVSERRPQYGYTYKWNLKLRVSGGKVGTLTSEQGAYGSDEQTCALSLGDLEQTTSSVGILLEVPGSSSGSDAASCTVRIVADSDTMWVRFGDATRTGNDCRAVADTMFCSPRAFWNDIVIDRRTKQCRPLQ